MRFRAFAVAILGLLVQGANTLAAEERPELKNVSAIRIANYGTPSTVIQDRAQMNALLAELRQLRGKAWRRGDTKLSCYATLVVDGGTRPVTLFRIGKEHVVERAPGKGQSSHSIALGQGDLPGISALLASIPPPKDCI
jgi:hypothetical protein